MTHEVIHLHGQTEEHTDGLYACSAFPAELRQSTWFMSKPLYPQIDSVDIA